MRTVTVGVGGLSLTLRAASNLSRAELERILRLRRRAARFALLGPLGRRHCARALTVALSIIGLDMGVAGRVSVDGRIAILQAWAEACSG